MSRYCETDIVNTYRLWLIYEEFRGALSPAELAWGETQLGKYIRLHKAGNSHPLDAAKLLRKT